MHSLCLPLGIREASLALVGDTGDAASYNGRNVSSQIRNHVAAERIRVTGKLPLQQVAQEVARFDAFLFPMDVGATTRSGTLPLPLGSGVPVVAFRGVDTGPLFVADENIVFASTLTGSAFADAATRLHNDSVLRDRVIAGGRRLYQEHLSWEAVGDQFLSLTLKRSAP